MDCKKASTVVLLSDVRTLRVSLLDATDMPRHVRFGAVMVHERRGAYSKPQTMSEHCRSWRHNLCSLAMRYCCCCHVIGEPQAKLGIKNRPPQPLTRIWNANLLGIAVGHLVFFFACSELLCANNLGDRQK